MKQDIQEKLAKEYAGLSIQEIRERQRDKIANNPILGKFLKKSVSPLQRSRKQEMINV